MGQESVVKGCGQASLVRGHWSEVKGSGQCSRATGQRSLVRVKGYWSVVKGPWSNHFLSSDFTRIWSSRKFGSNDKKTINFQVCDLDLQAMGGVGMVLRKTWDPYPSSDHIWIWSIQGFGKKWASQMRWSKVSHTNGWTAQNTVYR